MDNLAKLTVSEASALIKGKKISPVELVESCLNRIEQYEPKIKAWVTLVADKALVAAKKAESEIINGYYKGPLHGIPYGAKDIYLTKDIKTSAGSLVNPEFIPTENATVINILESAGAILLGKTTTAEYAFLNGLNDTRNPWNINHTPGGSSTGSGAAVGADMCLFALGTQTVGSLLRPSSYNNLTCLKGTYGRISCHNIIPCSYSLDHAGVLTKSVEDTAIINSILYEHDPLDFNSLPDQHLDLTKSLSINPLQYRIGIPDSFFISSDKVINEKFQESILFFKERGFHVEEVTLPNLIDEAFAAQDIVMCAEAASYHENYMETVPEKYGIYTRTQLAIGQTITAQDYIKAQKIRTVWETELNKLYEKVDLILTPSTYTLPPKGTFTGSPLFSGLFTNAGFPAMTIPMGFDSETNLPIGLQITARKLQEEKIISLGYYYQSNTSFHKRHALE